MKKKIRIHINILLGALIALLGVGCHSQKKAAEAAPVKETSEQTIRLMYGVPVAQTDTTQSVGEALEERAEKVVIDEDSITRNSVRVKYGVPAVRKTK